MHFPAIRSHAEIETKLFDIVRILLNNVNDTEERIKFDNTILHSILSESSQALEFVCLIEDEFDIEFEDEEVDIFFFSSFEHIENLILGHLGKQ